MALLAQLQPGQSYLLAWLKQPANKDYPTVWGFPKIRDTFLGVPIINEDSSILLYFRVDIGVPCFATLSYVCGTLGSQLRAG